jgi:hypothetical protein
MLTLQTLKFLWQNLNIAWTLVPIYMKLGLFIMPHEAVSTAYIKISAISNTNITGSQIVSVVIVFYLNAQIDCHGTWYVYHATMRSTWEIPLISNTNIKTFKIVNVVTLMPETVFMKLGMCMMPSSVFSAVCLVNQTHQQYKHCKGKGKVVPVLN